MGKGRTVDVEWENVGSENNNRKRTYKVINKSRENKTHAKTLEKEEHEITKKDRR